MLIFQLLFLVFNRAPVKLLFGLMPVTVSLCIVHVAVPVLVAVCLIVVSVTVTVILKVPALL